MSVVVLVDRVGSTPALVGWAARFGRARREDAVVLVPDEHAGGKEAKAVDLDDVAFHLTR